MPDPVKAAHYIQALCAARAEGNWEAVPEFVRKIRKHAPDRACLALTAEVEHSISTAAKQPGIASRPSTALTAKDLDVSNQLPKLLEVIENEAQFLEDKFQAQVCVGWLHWTVGEYSLAGVRLPSRLDLEQIQFDPTHKASEWTNVCALKAAYLKADCLVVGKQREEALRIFEAALPTLSAVPFGKATGKQLRYCSELFLTEFCMLQSQALRANERSLEDPNSLACFRSWADYWDAFGGSLGGHGFRGSVPRRRVWNEYFTALSTILELDLPYPTGHPKSIPAEESSARAHLRTELAKVETAYEALLLNETKFPRADEEREEVENFVKLTMRNWSLLCGRGWREDHLGPDGRQGISRRVLDVLYRAATKTYHSTTILRCLFLVHLSVAEFGLAFKAFDSYLDLVKHGKARVDKTGHLEGALDDDATVLETISQCILALCRYGGRDAAEKARDLGGELEDMMARLPQLKAGVSDGTTLPEIEETTSPLHPEVPPSTVALSWQAIGLSHAHWSRVTYDAVARTEIQGKAIRCLRKALTPELGRTRDVRSLFALGLLLAERRELSSAIELVKSALISNKSADGTGTPNHYHGPFWQQRSLISLWHLLALLLSARQDFSMAARACEGAFEQFKDPTVLFGTTTHPLFRSDHLNELEAADEKSQERRRGLVDDMDDAERESLLEIQVSQLMLVELLEGPEVAVNASDELLSLFSRLFGDVQASPNKSSALGAPAPPQAPKSSAGTFRSIKGSIFGGRSAKSHDTAKPSAGAGPGMNTTLESEKASVSTRPQTTQTTASIAPTIQVTGENGHAVQRRPSRRLSSARRARSESGKRNSLLKRDQSTGRRRAPSAGSYPPPATMADGEGFFAPGPHDAAQQRGDHGTTPSKRQPAASSFSRGQTLSHSNSVASQGSRSTVSSYPEITSDATYTITSPLPIIQFGAEHERKQRVALLIRVWLVVAGFYRRAEMFEDCRGAIAEAQKLVQGLEATEREAETISASSQSPGWAEKKSIDELWGDVWAELGYLSLAKGAPFDARSEFEAALTRFPDHPSAIVGLSNILLDLYSEKLLPLPTMPDLATVEDNFVCVSLQSSGSIPRITTPSQGLPSTPIGLGINPATTNSDPAAAAPAAVVTLVARNGGTKGPQADDDKTLPAAYKATSLPLIDRLAARDRANGLLSGLTKLGSSWDYPEAWFTLARAHEESGLLERAKEVLWWCVELEEGRGVREWRCLGHGGYVL
ncbi:hypothetical protein SODALDRAFT_316295 [Sodiomyces alkalinus F11]|uniref:Filamentation protein n=1 Tax=Sodiomyces alkalinus (strain CBS 110278 / VKM F-3762 / F11) TaxID=1314773 RepID=A0A3N2PNG2_SODAK|nr:hypothetical protein SODALDRAFT_316295 [Sodiomyces alkalinus F11]ROT36029.1 hypothetical protein SODALDRAFT_316295 [Sodiomyces alkalinus F11]